MATDPRPLTVRHALAQILALATAKASSANPDIVRREQAQALHAISETAVSAVRALDAAPAGTGSPTPAPDVEIDLLAELEDPDDWPAPARAEVARLRRQRDEARREVEYRKAAEADAIAVGENTRRLLHEAVNARATARAELSQVQRERDEKQEAIRGYQCMLDDIRAATGTAGATKDDPPTDLRALSVVVADMRIARDEARSALAALRAELLKIAEKRAAQAARFGPPTDETTGPDRVVWLICDEDTTLLRALVTDQSPRECSTCNGARVVKCAAHIAGDGCEDLALPCPDCTDQSPAARPDVDHRAQYWALRKPKAWQRARDVIAATDAAYAAWRDQSPAAPNGDQS